jgi:transcriptional regulator with XRE-family HTH domain
MTDTFGTRLRTERERRKIALSSIAENTKIGIALLQGLERDDVSRWPSGIFRKSFVRSYALALGLDPEPIVREFMERHPDPLQIAASGPGVSPGSGAPPLPAAGDSQARGGVVVKLTIVPPLVLRRWFRWRSEEI